MLREVAKVPGIKKVFVRSGIRYDYMLQDKNKEFFSQLVNHHISGQLKVAPEHCVASVLDYMGKPHFDVFEKFWAQYKRLNEKGGKEQYLVPYLMSSHPGCTLNDAVELAEFLKNNARQPEQVQDFYPTPGTISTCMYYTGIDPRDMSEVYVARDPHDKALQRALLQWGRPEKRPLVLEALQKAGRTDLIGYGKHCLIRPPAGWKPPEEKKEEKKPTPRRDDKRAERRDERKGRDEGRGRDERRGKSDSRGKKGDSGHKPPMSEKKKAAFAKKRAGKK